LYKTDDLARDTRYSALSLVIHFDRFKSYDSLVDTGYKKHVRVVIQQTSSVVASSAAITSTAIWIVMGF